MLFSWHFNRSLIHLWHRKWQTFDASQYCSHGNATSIYCQFHYPQEVPTGLWNKSLKWVTAIEWNDYLHKATLHIPFSRRRKKKWFCILASKQSISSLAIVNYINDKRWIYLLLPTLPHTYAFLCQRAQYLLNFK